MGNIVSGGKRKTDASATPRKGDASAKAAQPAGSEGASKATGPEVEEREVVLPPHMRNFKRERRQSVSAEAMGAYAKEEKYEKKVYPKTDDERERIKAAIAKNFIFSSLDEDQEKEVIDAMFAKEVKDGEVVIQQGDQGDNFYVIDNGEFDIFVKKGDEEKKVLTLGFGGSFGELALLYGMPRAATVKASKQSKLWAVDRLTFRRILMDTTSKKRKMYEDFLLKVPLLESLTDWERATIADALEPTKFGAGEHVISQGEQGDMFYFVEKGELKVTKRDPNGSDPDAEVEVLQYGPGDYFGELALINNKPRAATVTASSDVTLAFMDRDAFTRLLGPCDEILKRNMGNYENFEVEPTPRPASEPAAEEAEAEADESSSKEDAEEQEEQAPEEDGEKKQE